jgi:N-acetyl-anhydromuramyl-L-alanine amidase AmpD
MTADQYAPKVLQAGVDLGITPKGIVIGFATVFVESNWTMYANASVPDSMSIPHDAVGSDAYSVGLFQQQVVDSGNGWWWGDAATCMDPYKSAQLFFSRLKKLDYNSAANTPGSYAQAIQQSAFPDRYDQRMTDAQALYNKISGGTVIPAPTPLTPVGPPPFTETDLTQNNNNCESRAGYAPRLIILHTEEGSMQGSAFVQWMANNGVSYGYIVNPDGSVDDMETDDVASWSVLDPANEFSINICFATSTVKWTRQQWLDNMAAGIRSAAYLAVRKCLAFNIPIQILVGADYPKVVTQGGITDHNAITVTQLSPGSTHTDVGPNFPWDVFATQLAQYTPGAPAPTPAPPVDPPAVDPLVEFNNWVADATDRQLLEYITRQIGPGDPAWESKNKTLRDKVFGV